MIRKQTITEIAKLSWPISLGLVANLSMQLMDTAFVGRIGALALGGVSLGNSVFSVFLGISVGFLLGLEFLFAKLYGNKHFSSYSTYLWAGIAVALPTGLVAIFLMQFSPSVYHLFQVSEDLTREASLYLAPLSLSLLPFLIFMVFRQLLQSMTIVIPTLIIAILANGVNFLLNYIFVWGGFGFPKLGVQGSALATLLSRSFMLVAIIFVTQREVKKYGIRLLPSPLPLKSIFKALKETLRLGAPAALQMLLEIAAFSMTTLFAGRLGAETLGAHQIVLQIASLTFMISLGISSATATLVGNKVGEKDYASAKSTGWNALAYGTGVMALSGLLLFLFPNPIARLFTTDLKTIVIALALLKIAAFFQIFDGAQVVATGALRGIGNTKIAAITNFIGHWLIGLPLAVFCCYPLGFGIQGIWMGLSVGLIVVAIGLILMWKRLLRTLYK